MPAMGREAGRPTTVAIRVSHPAALGGGALRHSLTRNGQKVPAQMAGALPMAMSPTGKVEPEESRVWRARGQGPSAADSLSDSFSIDRSP
jgi:hypothetical protein